MAEKTITQETADAAITIMEQKAIASKLENELIRGKTMRIRSSDNCWIAY